MLLSWMSTKRDKPISGEKSSDTILAVEFVKNETLQLITGRSKNVFLKLGTGARLRRNPYAPIKISVQHDSHFRDAYN